MTHTEKKNFLVRNTILWVAAMVLPAVLSLALAGTKFPWQVLVPLLLLGCMLASNKMLTRALEQSGTGAGDE